jgi:hypothetical protein
MMTETVVTAKAWVSAAILETYNECWRQDGDPVLDAGTMAAALTHIPEQADPDDDVGDLHDNIVLFDPGELFGGHILVVNFKDGQPSTFDIWG